MLECMEIDRMRIAAATCWFNWQTLKTQFEASEIRFVYKYSRFGSFELCASFKRVKTRIMGLLCTRITHIACVLPDKDTKMRKINALIVHNAATYDTMDIGVEEIRQVHIKENGWRDVGYHYVIRRNGVIEKGRDEATVGAHVTGHNANSIGICLAGGLSKIDGKTVERANFTDQQYDSLYKLLTELMAKYPLAKLYGHSDFANKFCPGFDVRTWFKNYQQAQRASSAD